jgi:hypothetical protein
MRFKRPTLAQVQTVFGGIELFCSQLIAGEVYSTEDGTVLYKDIEALSKSFKLSIDFEAMKEMAKKLKDKEEIPPEFAKRFEDSIIHAKKAYFRMNVYKVREIVRSLEIGWRIRGEI